MPTLKGKWYFKDTLDKGTSGTTISTNISFSYFVNDNTTYSGTLISGSFTDISCYIYYYTDILVPVYNGTWVNQAYRSIEITSPTEVSEEFYNWFTKNAVDLQPTGTWRFNKTLTIPAGDLVTTCQGLCTNQHWGSSPVVWLKLSESSSSTDWQLQCGVQHDGIGDAYTEYLWTSTSGWGAGEDCRILTFHDNLTELNPEFALWFYENAHSTELKLYSECYIAEAVDTIRSITGVTKGYTVKDLVTGIEEVKAATTQKLTNYGTWCFKDDIDSNEWWGYILDHNTGAFRYEYDTNDAALTFNVDFSTVGLIEANSWNTGSSMTETTEFTIMEFHANSAEQMFYYTPDPDTGDTFCAQVGDNGSFYDDAARTITLREEPSAELLDFLNTFATKVDCVLQAKTVSPSASIQEVKPDAGYDGLSSVIVNACSGTKSITSTSNVNVVGYKYAKVSDSDLVASNIKSGVNILGVTGTYSGSGPNTATVQITAAGVMFNEGEGFDVTYTTNGKSCQTYATVHRSLTFQADIGSTVTIHGLSDILPSSSSFSWNWQDNGDDLTFTVVSSGGIMDISASS